MLVQAGYEFVADRFSLASELNECFEISKLAGYLAADVESFLQAGALTQDLAGAVLVGIEVGFSGLFLQLVKLALPGVDVKETSALPRCAF